MSAHSVHESKLPFSLSGYVFRSPLVQSSKLFQATRHKSGYVFPKLVAHGRIFVQATLHYRGTITFNKPSSVITSFKLPLLIRVLYGGRIAESNGYFQATLQILRYVFGSETAPRCNLVQATLHISQGTFPLAVQR